MALYDEEVLRKERERNKRTKRIVLTGIILTLIIIIALIVLIFYLVHNPNKITISLNGTKNTKLESYIIPEKTDEGTILYTPIKDIAGFFKYTSNDGEYITNFESEDSCYVETEKEVIIFSSNSDIMYKLDKTDKNSEYEAIKIDYPIVKKDDKIYVNVYVLRDAFNMYIPDFDEKTKKLDLWTLDNLIQTMASVVTDNGYEKMDEALVNQKAILDGMFVVHSKDGKIGVIDQNGGKILGNQYDAITYIPQKKAFLVGINGKFGIYGRNGQELISPQYEEITLIDPENELYLAKNNGRYGVIDINGQTKIYLDYDKIGVDINSFKENGLKSGYVLLGKLIPVQQNGLWMFYEIKTTNNLDGTKNVECRSINTQFEEVGCITKTTESNVSNLMVLKDYGVVVVKKNNNYGFMYYINGKVALEPVYEDVYMKTASGQTNYYMVNTNDKKIYNVIEELEKRGYTKINQ